MRKREPESRKSFELVRTRERKVSAEDCHVEWTQSYEYAGTKPEGPHKAVVRKLTRCRNSCSNCRDMGASRLNQSTHMQGPHINDWHPVTYFSFRVLAKLVRGPNFCRRRIGESAS